jgi:hemerythrin-like domain-containing protein
MKTSDREILKGYYWNHDAIRRDVERLKRLSQRAAEYTEADWPGVKKWFDYHKACLHEHHSGEDNFFFPMMRERDPSFANDLDIMDRDHKELVRLMGELDALMPANGQVDKLRTTIDAYGALVVAHLDREEVMVEAVINKNFTKEQILELEEAYRKKIPRKTMQLMMPWMVDAMDEKDRKYFFKMVPFFVKWIYNGGVRKKYERMVGAV